MNEPSNNGNISGRVAPLFLSGVFSVAAIGYVVGLSDGVPRPSAAERQTQVAAEEFLDRNNDIQSDLIPATSYADMRRSENGPTGNWNVSLAEIPQPKVDVFAEIQPSAEDKQQSLVTRASRRAFNGAPPVIPHAINGTSDGACYECHGKGITIGGRRAGPMSHPFLANCTQCHGPPAPQPLAQVASWPAENSFVGLATPMSGKRAYPGAPPTIPHSTLMRDNCLACHGRGSSWRGLESTHPWRNACQQCHGPSATLEQGLAKYENSFLQAPVVEGP